MTLSARLKCRFRLSSRVSVKFTPSAQASLRSVRKPLLSLNTHSWHDYCEEQRQEA